MRTRDTDKEELVKTMAIEMLVEEGFEGFSMNRLAKKCKISVATLYIYYQDKDDLIKKIGIAVGKTFFDTALKGFSPDMPFAEGLKKQWNNRIEFAFNYPLETKCQEIIRHSPHGEYVLREIAKDFGAIMKSFCHNAVERKELVPVSLEVFWSIAYGPLYNMLRFHSEGKSFGNKVFQFNEKMKDEAFDLVIKALTP